VQLAREQADVISPAMYTREHDGCVLVTVILK
jgi:hypothetical protein